MTQVALPGIQSRVDMQKEINILRLRLQAILNRVVSLRHERVTASRDMTNQVIENVILADATGGAITVTLPDAVRAVDHVIVVKKIDASANAVTIDGAGADTVDGAATVAISTQYHFRMMISDGSNWHVIGS